jgi:predicted AAA+ superfamily ATPase
MTLRPSNRRRAYREHDGPLSYWRLASGIEVDFVLGDMQVAIEAKSSALVTRDHLKGLRSLVEDHPRVNQRVVVCNELRARTTADGIDILPAATFVERLRGGQIVR